MASGGCDWPWWLQVALGVVGGLLGLGWALQLGVASGYFCWWPQEEGGGSRGATAGGHVRPGGHSGHVLSCGT